VKTNTELAEDVRAELEWDPAVTHPDEIAVGADDGLVTLRGTVGSLHQKRVAEKAAKRVRGTLEVDNTLKVRLMDDWAREDAEIRGAALQALEWNTSVPADRIDVKVDAGHVTLTGNVDWRYEKDAAESAVSFLAGVVAVENDIAVASHMAEVDGMSERIDAAFKRNAQTQANHIRISAIDGRVALSGDVSSWAEHDAAMSAAYAAPGVREVDDRLTVTG
jgi:osmotically-inducible protein OsmY